MNYLKPLVLILTVVLFFSCKKDEVNNPPKDFEASIEFKSNRLKTKEVNEPPMAPHFKVSWTEAVDPDGDKITYNVYLNDELKKGNISDLTVNLSMEDVLGEGDEEDEGQFEEDGGFTIKVIAIDPSEATAESTTFFSFKENAD
jgi:hypothetical protein